MTKDKAVKRATRARMAKTGERYAAARSHVANTKQELDLEEMPQSDAAIRKSTGKGWKEWVRVLDAWGARQHKHGEIAKHVSEEYGIPGWWCQAVTVGYERATGMRAKHQRASGEFTVNVSKTMKVGVSKVFKAFAEAPQRNKWLDTGTLKVRTSRKNKDIRFDHEDGDSRVVVYFESKGRAKTTVTLEHGRLPEAAWVEKMRAIWKLRLGDLADRLEQGG